MRYYIEKYITTINAFSNKVGLFTMYMIFIMIAVLFYSSISKTFFTPSFWTLEISQFMMMTYFVLGGSYSLKEGSHVRMDLFYERLKPKNKRKMDAVVMICLIFYLVVLLIGGIDSLIYAIKYSERSYSSWAPYMAPIKVILNIGILLTLLQAIAIWLQDMLYIKDH